MSRIGINTERGADGGRRMGHTNVKRIEAATSASGLKMAR